MKNGKERIIAEGGGFRAGISNLSISSFEIEEYKYESPKFGEEKKEKVNMGQLRSKADLNRWNKFRENK